MREIKFKFIVERNGIKYLSAPYTLTNEDGLPNEEKVIEDMEGPCNCPLNESVSQCEGDCMEWEEATVVGRVQFIGKQDKNGVEIYAGDRIRRNTGYEFVVEKKRYSIGPSCRVWGYEIDKDDEVIGNIHEKGEQDE